MENKCPTIKEWKEKYQILERALAQSKVALENAKCEIQNLNTIITAQQITIKVLGGMVGGAR